jgi:hypothetical protein
LGTGAKPLVEFFELLRADEVIVTWLRGLLTNAQHETARLKQQQAGAGRTQSA